jgi:hypothetical protein
VSPVAQPQPPRINMDTSMPQTGTLSPIILAPPPGGFPSTQPC